jgi:hypothetical protein
MHFPILSKLQVLQHVRKTCPRFLELTTRYTKVGYLMYLGTMVGVNIALL